MNLTPSYLVLLVAAALAIVVLVVAYVLRKRWTSRPTRLRLHLERKQAEPPSPFTEDLVALLMLEEQYPSFADIVGLVLDRFPAARFFEDPDFRSAMSLVTAAPYDPTETERLEVAMCQIVRWFLRDPDVEYECRPELTPLVDRFLEEIHITPE